jgi:hypothetical protein
MPDFTISLTDAQVKALEYVAVSPQDWIENCATARADQAKGEIVTAYVAHKNAANEAITAVGVDAQVLAAYSEGVVDTAANREAAFLSSEGGE